MVMVFPTGRTLKKKTGRQEMVAMFIRERI